MTVRRPRASSRVRGDAAGPDADHPDCRGLGAAGGPPGAALAGRGEVGGGGEGVPGGLTPPIGRRAQIVREVWQRLSRGNRARVLSTPKRPFWVRQPLLERPLPTLYWYAKWPLAIGGWLGLALVLIQYWKPRLLPGWIAPPAPLLE